MLSSDERYARLCWGTSKLVNLMRVGKGMLTVEYPQLSALVNQLWPAMLCEHDCSGWALGGDLDTAMHGNDSTVVVALREAALAARDYKSKAEPSPASDTCYDGIGVITLLSRCPKEAAIAQAQYASEGLAYCLRRHDDAWARRYAAVNRVVAQIQGELMSCIAESDIIYQAWCIHHLADKILTSVEEDDALTLLWTRFNVPAMIKAGPTRDTNALTRTWAENSHRRMTFPHRIMATVALIGNEIRADVSDAVMAVAVAHNKGKKADTVDIKALNNALTAAKVSAVERGDIAATERVSTTVRCPVTDGILPC